MLTAAALGSEVREEDVGRECYTFVIETFHKSHYFLPTMPCYITVRRASKILNLRY